MNLKVHLFFITKKKKQEENLITNQKTNGLEILILFI